MQKALFSCVGYEIRNCFLSLLASKAIRVVNISLNLCAKSDLIHETLVLLNDWQKMLHDLYFVSAE